MIDKKYWLPNFSSFVNWLLASLKCRESCKHQRQVNVLPTCIDLIAWIAETQTFNDGISLGAHLFQYHANPTYSSTVPRTLNLSSGQIKLHLVIKYTITLLKCFKLTLTLFWRRHFPDCDYLPWHSFLTILHSLEGNLLYSRTDFWTDGEIFKVLKLRGL